MSFGHMQFYSKCLCRSVTFQIFLPNDIPDLWKEGNPHFGRPLKNLMLLHGYNGGYSDWRNNSQIADLANQYHIAIITPDGENSFYLDGKETGRKYAAYIGEELPEFLQKTFHLSEKPEDNFIGGYSMGGFGAIHTALQFHGRFSKLFALSSALIVHNVEKMQPGTEDEVANYDYYRLVFGNPDELDTSVNNPEELVRRIKKEGKEPPEIYMACGTEDFLLEENRSFHRFLKEQGVPCTYLESPGAHDFKFWNEYLEPAIQWLVKEK